MAATFTHRAGRAGFSLAELVVAMGILGVGMAMAAALFPAGLVGTQDCLNDTTGTIVCHNLAALLDLNAALILADVGLQDPANLNTFVPLADEATVSCIAIEDQHYPDHTAASRNGFVLLGTRVDRDGNLATQEGYQFIAVAYRKKSAANHAVIYEIPGIIQGTNLALLPGIAPGRPWLKGALVIDRQSGQYARVVDLAGDDAQLGGNLDCSGSVYLVRELDSTNNVVSSPGIAVLSVWTDFVP
jgi:prepilin-type N-terminal cleavage/methylation domain-containing protein